MLVLITYDVSTVTKEGRRRLRCVAKICENYGQRVQYSVFECKVDQSNLFLLREQLLKAIDEGEDSLRIYRLTDNPTTSVEEYGKNYSIDFEDPLIV